jgi:hypothetical protein
MSRQNEIRIRLDHAELEQLDELRHGVPRAVYLRSLLHRPPEVADVASREESLAILTSQARDGKVTAAIALARELRGEFSGDDDPLDDLLRAK